ncbi:hypothetical protein C8J56DRAFT_935320, partial [Mycena floridula]
MLSATLRCGPTLIRRANSTKAVPIQATWSVKELISSYPSPTISSATLNHLHRVSALIPPAEGSTEFEMLKHEMEDMVKLVHAVKLVDTSTVELQGWNTRDELNQVDLKAGLGPAVEENRDLLSYASRSVDGLYVVEADKARE